MSNEWHTSTHGRTQGRKHIHTSLSSVVARRRMAQHGMAWYGPHAPCRLVERVARHSAVDGHGSPPPDQTGGPAVFVSGAPSGVSGARARSLYCRTARLTTILVPREYRERWGRGGSRPETHPRAHPRSRGMINASLRRREPRLVGNIFYKRASSDTQSMNQTTTTK